MADPQSAAGTRPAGAPPYEPVVRLGTPAPVITGTQLPSRHNPPVLMPPDDVEVDDDVTAVAPAPADTAVPASRPAPKVRWYTYVASGLAGAVVVTAIYGLLAARSGSSGNSADKARAGVPVSDTAMLDRRADTLALAISAFSMRATMFDTRRMPCSGLARGLTQVEDAWLGYNIARKDLMAGIDPARDARDKSLYADVRGVEVKFERSACARP